MPYFLPEYYGRQFDKRRTKDAHGDMGILRGNFVNMTLPAGSTHFDHLMEFSRSSEKPFPIKFLSEKLKERRFPRGHVYYGTLSRQIERVLLNYSYMRWWLEKDGLVVEEAKSELGPLSGFDRTAGPLVIEYWKDGELSTSSLKFIASRLDAEGFQLNGNLQPSQWKPILEYNQKHSKVAIKTFVGAAVRPNSPAVCVEDSTSRVTGTKRLSDLLSPYMRM